MAKPESERTDAERRHVAWMDGQPEGGTPPRYYTPTALHD